MFGVYPLYGAAVFATCILVLFPLAARDRRAYGNLPFAPGVRPDGLPKREQWVFFCFVDVLVLGTSGIAMIRDFFSPPRTDEQQLLHVMALGIFAISALCGLILLRTRPHKSV